MLESKELLLFRSGGWVSLRLRREDEGKGWAVPAMFAAGCWGTLLELENNGTGGRCCCN